MSSTTSTPAAAATASDDVSHDASHCASCASGVPHEHAAAAAAATDGAATTAPAAAASSSALAEVDAAAAAAATTDRELAQLLQNNRDWAARMEEERPGFFRSLALQQKPKYLWIGCADSRVPANEIIGLLPGEVFVHRNVANLVVHSDLNCLSVLDFAVNVLKVEHIIVCGHYGCGGVTAALGPSEGRVVDHWIRHVRDIAKFYRGELETHGDLPSRARRLCELNVAVQVVHVRESPVMQSPQGRAVKVHGWIYDLADGLLRDLTPMVDKLRVLEPSFGQAV